MLGNDPQAMCDPWGVPRMLNGQVAGPHATIEMVQLPDRTFTFSQWHHDYRVVWTDGRQLPKLEEVEPRWNGYSVGKWEGNTFVVNSLGFDERTWLDHNGYPHTDQMRLEERYRRLDADTLELVETITDPQYYSKPFRSDTKIWKLDREGGKAWDEQIYCVPSEEFKFNKLSGMAASANSQPAPREEGAAAEPGDPAPFAVTFRRKNSYVDLTGLATIRWFTKTSGFHVVRPVVKLANGNMLVGDAEFFSITMLTQSHPDLSKVDLRT